MKDRECLWNTRSEHYREETARENALQEIVQELNFPELGAEDLSKTIGTMYVATVITSGESGAGPHDIYVPKFFEFKQELSFLRGPVYSMKVSVNKSSFCQ